MVCWLFCFITDAELRPRFLAETPFWWKEDLHFCLKLLSTRCKNTRDWRDQVGFLLFFFFWMAFASSGYGQAIIVLRCSTGLTHVLKISTVQCVFSFLPLKEKKNQCERFQSSLGFENWLAGMLVSCIYQRCRSVQLLRHQMEALLKVYRRVSPRKRKGNSFKWFPDTGTGRDSWCPRVKDVWDHPISHELCGPFCWLQRLLWF